MTSPVESRVIRTATHGRYLLRHPDRPGPSALVVGFHGYAETADIQMERLASIRDAGRFILVAIQGLHRFYAGRSERIAASWMTSQDRELAIDDNRVYVQSVVAEVATARGRAGPVFFAGFSQGVAMAFRAACASPLPVGGVIGVGGDVPPELDRGTLSRLPHVWLGRGDRDEWYTPAKHSADRSRLAEADVDVEAPVLNAVHEWTPETGRLIGEFLQKLTG